MARIKKARQMYVCRDYGSDVVELHTHKPRFAGDPDYGYYCVQRSAKDAYLIQELCCKEFKRFTGLDVAEGECVKVRLSVEVL